MRASVVSGAVLLALLPVAVTACSSAQAGGGSGPATVHIALADDPSSLDPQAVEDGNALAVYGNVNEALVFRTAADNKPIPGLALSWSNTSPKTWEFNLRPNVTFSDGEAFNADAVVYSIKRITNPKYPTQQSDWVGDITGATKVGNLTVDITTSAPDPQIPARMSLIMMVGPKSSQRADFATHPVGTGPYVMSSWLKGSQAVITANPRYWGGAPQIKKAIFQPVKEPTLRLSSLTTGEINLVSDLLPEQMSQVPKAVRAPGLEFPTLILNTRGGPFADVRVRQAANYAVDKQAILQKLYSGFGKIANCQIMGPAVFGYNPTLKPFDYDLNKAKSLLAEANQPHPSITLVGDSTGRWLKDVELEQAIAGYLTNAGFNVKLQLADFATYLKALFPQTNNAKVSRPDSVFVSHDNVLGDADVTFSTYMQSTGSGASTKNSQMDQLVLSGRNGLDSATRENAYHQVNAMACTDADFLFLMNLDNVYGTTKNLSWSPRYDAAILVKDMRLG